MKNFKIHQLAENIGTRKSGEIARYTLLYAMNVYEKVTIDFQNINSISYSFADEFIGKIVVTNDWKIFMEKVRLINVSPFVEQIIRQVIDRRRNPSLHSSS